MKKLKIILGITLIFALFIRCEKEQTISNEILKSKNFIEEVSISKPATVELIDFSSLKNSSYYSYIPSEVRCLETLSPTSLSTTLDIGESIQEVKNVCLEGLPSQGDVLFAIDLSGSMSGEINNLKNNSINIMNAISNSLPNSHFGLMSFTGYGNSPFILDQSITVDKSSVTSAINTLSANGGGHESYTTTLNEAHSNPSIGWRTGSAKVIVYWLDESGYQQEDPITGTPDGLFIDDVIANLANDNIILITLVSNSSYYAEWLSHSQATGGTAVQINSDGTIPSGENIEDLITGLIEDSVSKISTLTLQANPSTYNSWITSLSPASYTNIDLSNGVFNNHFDLTITVPINATEELHEFKIELVGDGAVFGLQTVAITVDSIDKDKDGCLNEDDPYPNSNLSEEISIDGCYPGVENKFVGPCTTMMDEIDAVIANVWEMMNSSNRRRNFDPQRQFQEDMKGLLNKWYRRYERDLISDADKFKITKCVRQSRIFDPK